MKLVSDLETKQSRYARLVQQRKEYRYKCNGIVNPSELSIDNDEHLNAWAYWHGNLDAEILVIGQDFGDVNYYKKYKGLDSNLNGTNTNLIKLFNQLGITLGCPPCPNRENKLYFTNAVLGAKMGQVSTKNINGGMASPIKKRDWFADTSIQFIKPLIEIVEPKVIITLGCLAYRVMSIIYKLNEKPLKKLVDHNPIILCNNIKLFTLYHCSGLGLISRNFDKQLDDWKKIKFHL